MNSINNFILLLIFAINCNANSTRHLEHTIKYYNSDYTKMRLTLLDYETKDTLTGKISLNMSNIISDSKITLEYSYPKTNNVYKIDHGRVIFEKNTYKTFEIELRDSTLNDIVLFVPGGYLSTVLASDTSITPNYQVKLYRKGGSLMDTFKCTKNKYLPIGDYKMEVNMIPPYKMSFSQDISTQTLIAMPSTGNLKIKLNSVITNFKLYRYYPNKEIEWLITDYNLIDSNNGIDLSEGRYNIEWKTNEDIKHKVFKIDGNKSILIELE